MRSKLVGMAVRSAAAATLALATSCTLLAQVQRLGVTADAGGSIVVHYVPCPNEAVTRVTLSVGDPEEGGEVLWEIAGVAGPQQGTFPVGSTPAGFTETVALRAIPSGAELTVLVQTQEGALSRTSSLSFDPGSLERGAIFTLGGSKDPATFERDALETCES